MNLSKIFEHKYQEIQNNRKHLNLVAKNGISEYISNATKTQLDLDEFMEKITLLLEYFDPGYLNKLNNQLQKYENLTDYATLKNYLRHNEHWKNYTKNLKPFEFDNLAEAIFKFSVIKLEPQINLNLIPDYSPNNKK